MDNDVTQLDISARMQRGKKVVITEEINHKVKLPPFHGIGGNTSMTTTVKGYDNLYSVLQDLTKKATWLWWGLLQVRDTQSNQCRFKAKDNVEAKKITAAYKELKSLDLVVRVSKQLYMVNPIAMLPEFKNYPEIQEKWTQLKGVTK